MRALWLAEVLRDAGLTVVEHDGWKTRGWEPWEPRYGIVHATAAPRTQSDSTQVAIVRDGRADLQGPIANCAVDRTGRWHVLASGRCNTARVGWDGPADGLGNEFLLGVEGCNDNGLAQPPELWPDRQYQAYARGWAAISRRMGWTAGRLIGHKEHQPGDKSDPTFSMTTFRARVAQNIEEDDMPYKDWPAADRQQLAKDVADAIVGRQIAKLTGDADTITVGGALSHTHKHAFDTRNGVLGTLVPRVQAVLTAVSAGTDLTEAQLTAAVAAGVQQGLPDPLVLAQAVADAVDDDLDVEAVAEALRQVLTEGVGQPGDGS